MFPLPLIFHLDQMIRLFASQVPIFRTKNKATINNHIKNYHVENTFTASYVYNRRTAASYISSRLRIFITSAQYRFGMVAGQNIMGPYSGNFSALTN